MKKIISAGIIVLVINSFMGGTIVRGESNAVIAAASTVTIKDLNQWQHPAKEVFKKNKLTLVKVELTNNKKYPIFVVKSLGDFSVDSSDFLYSLAEKNGYWDFSITDGTRYINVYCDKTRKIITKAESGQKTMDIADLHLSTYNGIWLDVSFANKTGYYSKMNITFVGKNQAHIILESSTAQTGTAQIVTNVYFDYNQEAKLTGTDSSGNTIKAKISFYDGEVRFTMLSNAGIKNKKKMVTAGFGSFEREADYLNIQKSMKLLIQKYGFVDSSEGFYIPKTEDDSFYLGYEGRTDDGRYRIAVRYCRDTVIYAWYLVNPDTKEIEMEIY